jgi:hypothetical protein
LVFVPAGFGQQIANFTAIAETHAPGKFRFHYWPNLLHGFVTPHSPRSLLPRRSSKARPSPAHA